MSTEWITDRLPTREDADECGLVWVSVPNGPFGIVERSVWRFLELGTPWQPIQAPAPYVKAKKYTIKWNDNLYIWNVYEYGSPIGVLPRGLPQYPDDAAQRICDIYNEVMP